MNTKKILATVLLSTVLFTGCGLKNSKAIVKVNDHEITQAEFDTLFNEAVNNPALAQFGLKKNNNKNNFLYLMIKDRVINELIIKTLITDEMEKRNIKVSKKDTDAELKNIIDKVGSKEKFNEILKQNGITAAQFKKDLEEEVKMKKLVDVLQKIEVTEADAKKYYNDNVAKFKYPEKVRASHILIAANPEELAEVIKQENKTLNEKQIKSKVSEEIIQRREKAQKVLAEVKKDPTAFAKLAKENSDDTITAKRGGDLGFFAKQEMVEPFAKAAFTMKPNTISEIVQTPYGYHIILVTDRTAAGQDSYESVKNEIVTYLENQKRVKVLENFIDTLRKNAKIDYVNPEYNPENIQEILKDSANPAIQQVEQPKKEAAKPAQTKPTPAKPAQPAKKK